MCSSDLDDGERISDLPTFCYNGDHAKLSDRALYYNGLCVAWPEVRFHVFPTLPVADWFVLAGTYGTQARQSLVGDQYLRRFRTLLDPAIGFGWAAEGCSFEEAISCYYRTDHHWGFRGAYRVYRQLWLLLHQQNPRVGQVLDSKGWIELPGLAFYGSLARRAGYYDAIGDVIVDGVFELPSFEVHIHGFGDRERNQKCRYRTGQYAREKFANHYAEYFGNDYGLIEYLSGASGGGNLLVIGDSFDNCIEPLLASHFCHSWFVDLRHYHADVGKEFDMDDFLARHAITDVLFVGNQYWVLGLKPLAPVQ